MTVWEVGAGALGEVVAAAQGQVLRLCLLRHQGAHHALRGVTAGQRRGRRGVRGLRVRIERGRVRRALVVQKVVPPAEAAAAPFARERLLPVVQESVGLELVGVREARLAEGAAVGPLSRVHAEMAPQVGHLYEVARAVRATVWLLASVQAQVGFEVVVAREPLVTLSALEGLLARVGALVVLEDVLVSEGARADLAREQLITRGLAAHLRGRRAG